MSGQSGAMPVNDRAADREAGPLAGLRVLDISNFLAGPLASMFLADFGARVVKIERPGAGDELRFWGNNKNGVGLYYKVVNRNKKSVTADLHTPLGVEVVKRLASRSDVLVENFRPGTLERWGLGPDVLHAVNPRLVILRMTGFGQTGPYRDRPGFGTLAEAFSGFVFTNGYPDRPPLLPGFGLADATSGLMGAFLVLAAVTGQRASGGPGQVIDLALYETLLTLLGPQVVNFDQLGLVQQRDGSRLPFTAPRNTYCTRDGRYLSMAGSAQSAFERICHALERDDLPADPRFRDNRCRLDHAAELDVELQAAIGALSYAELAERFERLQATMAPVNDVAQVIADPHVQARGNIVAVADDELGSVRMQDVVGKMSVTPGAVRHAGPSLGADNYEVLVGELGFDEAALREAGIPLARAERAAAAD